MTRWDAPALRWMRAGPDEVRAARERGLFASGLHATHRLAVGFLLRPTATTSSASSVDGKPPVYGADHGTVGTCAGEADGGITGGLRASMPDSTS